MIFHCYLRRGVAYVPVVAKTTAGYYQDQEPIAVVPALQTDDLRDALKSAVASGNPIIPTPTRANMPPPIMPKYAGVKDWNTFARGVLVWTIQATEGTYKVIGHQKSPYGGLDQDPDQTVIMPPGSTVDDVIDRLIAILQEKARAPSRGGTRNLNAGERGGPKN